MYFSSIYDIIFIFTYDTDKLLMTLSIHLMKTFTEVHIY